MGTFNRNTLLQGHILANSLGGPGYVDPATAFRVRTVIAHALGKDMFQVGLDTDFESLGGNSILRVSVLASLEVQFKVRIADPVSRRFRTARDLAISLGSARA